MLQSFLKLYPKVSLYSKCFLNMEEKGKNLSEKKKKWRSLLRPISHTHTQRMHAFMCANRRGLPKLSPLKFPNVKKNKGVSNFLVIFSSSSEDGVEKREGMKKKEK